MTKPRIVLVFVILLIVAAGALARAEAAYFEWDLSQWVCNPDTGIPCLTVPTFDWQSDWPTDYDQEFVYQLYGPSPAVVDPDVEETITNLTPLEWTDWHVSIINGSITDALVEKVGGNEWDVDIYLDGSGFDAFALFPLDRVQTMDQLHIWFRFSLGGSGTVNIDEYPTTTTIPEPCSLAVLAAGIVALASGIRRRVR